MGHGCHVCGCPNGCECDEYAFSEGDWLEAKDQGAAKTRREDDTDHTASLRARYGDMPGKVSHRYLRDGKPRYVVNGADWAEQELTMANKSRIPTENAAHQCGMFCDGQDGSTSDCARRKRNAQVALESRNDSFIVKLNYSDHFNGASEGSPARLCEGKLGYTVGESYILRDSRIPAWRVWVPELDGHRESGETKQMTIHWPHESLSFLGERDPEPLAPLHRAYELQEAATGRKLTGSAAEIARAHFDEYARDGKSSPAPKPQDTEPTRFNLLEID